MIECELCGRFFHADEIEECPVCGKELCPECYENHVSKCLLGEFNFDEEYEEESLIPHKCPICKEPLELDIDSDGSARVCCSKCDFIEELNEEQLKELNNWKDDEDNFDKESDDYLEDDE